MSTDARNPIGVVGAGTMGAGIAQAAAGAGWHVKLYDINQSLVDQSEESIAKRFIRLVDMGIFPEA
jgi:3-hydroxybutyryl-CoA dehydrogenase